MKDLYSENYKTLLKEIKEDKNTWKCVMCSWMEELILPKAMCRLSEISTKVPMATLKSTWNHNTLQIATAILRKNKVEGITLPNFKLYYMAIIIKTIWYLYKNRQMDQWYRIESSGKKPSLESQLIFDESHGYSMEKVFCFFHFIFQL